MQSTEGELGLGLAFVLCLGLWLVLWSRLGLVTLGVLPLAPTFRVVSQSFLAVSIISVD